MQQYCPTAPSDRKALLKVMLGDDPCSSAIDCRPRLANGISENFRITMSDVARFIMELKQEEQN